jgi:hypothetical protein
MPTLNWLTREQDIEIAAKAEYRLLVEEEKYSYGDPDTGNLMVQGDNFEALKVSFLDILGHLVACKIYFTFIRFVICSLKRLIGCLVFQFHPANPGIFGDELDAIRIAGWGSAYISSIRYCLCW